jgi:energy-converting hydrogenase Eha subunit F
MVRERVGDWRLAWRFGLAGLLAELLAAVLSILGLINGPFHAAQDQLFPAPDPRVTFVAIDSRSAEPVRGVDLRPGPDKTCVENQADEPAFLRTEA